MTTMLISFLDGGSAAATPASLSDPKKTVIPDAGELTITNTSGSTLTVNSITVAISRPTIFRMLSLTSGSQTITPKRNKTMVFTFIPPISIAASGGTATFTLGATMTGLAMAGTPSSTQTIGALGVNGTEAGGGVTFEGLPTSLGTITLSINEDAYRGRQPTGGRAYREGPRAVAPSHSKLLGTVADALALQHDGRVEVVSVNRSVRGDLAVIMFGCIEIDPAGSFRFICPVHSICQVSLLPVHSYCVRLHFSSGTTDAA